MTVWTWILVGVGCFFVVSLLVGLGLAAILNRGARQFSELIELEGWASAAPHMALDDEPVDDAEDRGAGREYSGSQLA
jgi:hypothetical protein